MFEGHSSESENSASYFLQAAKAVGSFMLQGATRLGLSYYPPTDGDDTLKLITDYDVVCFRTFCQSDSFDAVMAKWIEQ